MFRKVLLGLSFLFSLLCFATQNNDIVITEGARVVQASSIDFQCTNAQNPKQKIKVEGGATIIIENITQDFKEIKSYVPAKKRFVKLFTKNRKTKASEPKPENPKKALAKFKNSEEPSASYTSIDAIQKILPKVDYHLLIPKKSEDCSIKNRFCYNLTLYKEARYFSNIHTHNSGRAPPSTLKPILV